MHNYFINFDTPSFFTKDYKKKKKIKFNFLGNELFLFPSFSNKTIHKILFRSIEDSPKGYVPLRQFLSSLSWKYDNPIIVLYHGGFGGQKLKITLMKMNSMKNYFGEWNINNLFEPKTKEQKIALGLYHQAMNTFKETYNPYPFLDFYKIIALIISSKSTEEASSKEVENFINSKLSKSNNFKEIVQPLLTNYSSYGVRGNSKTNVGKKVCKFRKLLAHALTGKKFIDLDEFLYWREFNILKNLLKDIAKEIMKKNLSIK